MYKFLKGKGRAVSDFYAGKDSYFLLSPAYYVLLKCLKPVFEEFELGKVLDAGAGRGAYRHLIEAHSDEYFSMDISAGCAISCIGDAQCLPFADSSFDTIFCSQVLEHVPRPSAAFSEFKRVLRPGGRLIATVPHMSWLHNEPHDYFRFTPHGLQVLLAEAGLSLERISAVGGLVSLVGHIPLISAINITYGIPFLHPAVRFLNSVLVRLTVCVDEILDNRKIFALNYLCLAKKSEK